MPEIKQPRAVERLVRGQPTTDGAGVKLTRVLTQDLQQRLDPFLMLDNFASDAPKDYGAGFPDHPHRGFETEQEEGRMEGFQLWLNLPGTDKMREPWYRDIQSDAIPVLTTAEWCHRARDRRSEEPPRALLIAGQPLREPIAQYGLFVMNTREQLLQAVEDLQRGRFA